MRIICKKQLAGFFVFKSEQVNIYNNNAPFLEMMLIFALSN